MKNDENYFKNNCRCTARNFIKIELLKNLSKINLSYFKKLGGHFMEQETTSEKRKEHLYDDFYICRNYMSEKGEVLFVNITCKERIFYCMQY